MKNQQSKWWIVLVLAILMNTEASGQEADQRKDYFIGLSAGVSLPVGTYASKELPDGSFTIPGFNISSEGSWFFSRSFGLGAQVEYNVHPVDVGSLGAEKVSQDPFLEDLIIRSDPYRFVSANIGVYYMLPLHARIDFMGKLMGGIMYGITPYQLYKPEFFLVEPKWYEITSARDWGYSMLTGAQIKYHFNPNVGLYLDTHYSYSQLEFEFTLGGGGSRTEVKHVMYMVLSLGLAFTL